MLAYRRTGNVPSSSTVPGKPRYRSSEAPQPRKPAAAAAAKTPWSDHAEAAREPAPLPAAARRADEVVKRCRPERQGLLLDLVRDRPSGRAALVKRFADMQEESRRTSTSCAAQIFGCFFSVCRLANRNNRRPDVVTGLAPVPGVTWIIGMNLGRLGRVLGGSSSVFGSSIDPERAPSGRVADHASS